MNKGKKIIIRRYKPGTLDEFMEYICIKYFSIFIQMIKLDRKPFKLKANTPNRLAINGGIDFYDDEIKLEYKKLKSSLPVSIYMSLITVTGQSFSRPIFLDPVGRMTVVNLSNSLENTLVEHHFDFIEFKSSFDFDIALTIETIEGGFLTL